MSFVRCESNFLGREHILDLLKKRHLGIKEGYRQNIALLGDCFVGKTSILFKFISDLEDDDVVPIYVDLENRDFQNFATKFIGSILYNYAKSKHLSLHEDLKVLITSTKAYIPKTVKEIEKIQYDLHHGKINDAYRTLIRLPEVFSNETNKFCIILLDEFQNLDGLANLQVFQELGKAIMTQKRSLYVVTSSYPELGKRILSEKLSLLFGDFEIVHVEPFDLKTSHQYIDHRLKGINMGVTLRSFLIDFTGGHPLYLNLLLNEMVSLSAVHAQKDIFSPLLVQAIENITFDHWGVLSRHFEISINNICSNKGNRVIASILMALSNQRFKLNELARHLEVKQSPLSQKVNRLIDSGLVAKNGNYLYLKDKLFRYWIKYVFQRRLKSFEIASSKLRREFNEEVNRSINSFKMNSRKDLSSRIVELLTCFDNEAFHINGRRYKLPLFHNIESVKLLNVPRRSFELIKATSSDGVWFIVLKRESIGENDVHVFLKESQKLNQKPLRCVIISMADLDQNAKLKALQERIWIWNESEINTLLNLYDKPYIV